ncbi:hypothetical protein BDV06DRAFT_231492 [Aspergillus oleicola]
MTNNSPSDNGTLFMDIRDYQSQLLSMAQHLSSPDYVQLCTPPLTPPPSPAADNGSLLCQDGFAMLPTQTLKHSARLAVECYHRRKFSKATLPGTTLYEYSREVAEDELSLQELYILSIFTLDVNASVPLTVFLQQSVQLSEPSVELSESECEELSNSFSPDMIHINRTTFFGRTSFRRQDFEAPGLSGLLIYSLSRNRVNRLSKAFMKRRNWMSLRSLFSLSWISPFLWSRLSCLFSLWMLHRRLAAIETGEIRVGSRATAAPS